mmetsp:Transcript_28938/g.57837  ORF Transcript_28938/g.57837 Transcript_28938/m.57837 type:complete len:600 (-) Transcript_28938:98-1897(-)|eukprot:CAMPEP_0182482968 /NCGR_PEP_ID=MMETSP1319-20130603/40317_1 /TAXON_ID=172717 /ORGANISM="Bolidomonas pacifica, Strain RCC208" /LENGTH=599 /DNA_ID=CAMNT_0024684723 /DNA_START=1 /DNA_END=1800 /DNA_ORIENTATION=+
MADTENLPGNTALAEALPSNDDAEAWRLKIIEYYRMNAPMKVRMVNQNMMTKYAGKYDTLYANLIKKYGPPGQPIAAAIAPGAGSKKTIGDFHDAFMKLVSKATPVNGERTFVDAVTAKASDASNGLETSTFTVCARVRPMLPSEEGQGGENFVAVVPGERIPESEETGPYGEEMLLCNPKVSIMGKPKLEQTKFLYDYSFGPDSTNEEVYKLVCKPLVNRALNGQVGVIFAYGQTGSGKTHTMNGVMDGLIESEIFNSETAVSFSYLELLGNDIKDCLGPEGAEPVAIGEALDGRVLTRNLTNHAVATSNELKLLVEKAKSLRSTAATTRNDTSSRSHGVGIIQCKDVETGIIGTLYIIDLAGSERAADQKNHDKARIAETKAINSSLSALKECIRARTMASAPGLGAEIHVPYRRSKLTLLMKDVFDIGCTRLCSTVVVTACSPLALDVSHTANTLKYSAPLRLATISAPAKSLQVDVNDPALWDEAQVLEYLGKTHPNLPEPSKFLNGLNGVHLCALPEKEFYKRAKEVGASAEVGKEIYLAVWALISDAKTRRRRPDGTIITKEDEEREREELIKAKEAKAALWAEREKHLRSES